MNPLLALLIPPPTQCLFAYALPLGHPNPHPRDVSSTVSEYSAFCTSEDPTKCIVIAPRASLFAVAADTYRSQKKKTKAIDDTQAQRAAAEAARVAKEKEETAARHHVVKHMARSYDMILNGGARA
ncbi:hypothetical protein EHS25_003228 [Saitozyma podzolica]|uniref:Uncharacterized protein n=1 Tax=Saitozyma podzolica TaxID=1890683 RepID=A0A427Y8A0_9TREE|nr:hypothetical protein EHS25_003228 [Saitozyma podzolica]